MRGEKLSRNYLHRIFHQYRRAGGFKSPSREWFNQLIKRRPLKFSDKEDIDRLCYVLVWITEDSIENRGGHMPKAKSRKDILEKIERVRSAIRELWASVDALHDGCRPDFEIPPEIRKQDDERLGALECWIGDVDRFAPKIGNSVDRREHARFTSLLGYYDLAFGLDWIEGRKSSEPIIGRKKDAAEFICAFMEATRKLIRTCTLVPERDRADILAHWNEPTRSALVKRMQTIRRQDIQCTLLEPSWIFTSSSVRPPECGAESRVVSVAQLYWAQSGGTLTKV